MTFSDGFSRDKYKHMAGYEQFLSSLDISFQWQIGKKLEYRDLTSPEKLKLFEHIQMSTILPNCQNSLQIQKLWADFIDIIGDLKLDLNFYHDVLYLKSKIEDWLTNVLVLYQTKHVTLISMPCRRTSLNFLLAM